MKWKRMGAAAVMAAFFLTPSFLSFASQTKASQPATSSDAMEALISHEHDLVTELSEPTCRMNGKKIITCRHCQEYREEIILPMLGHTDSSGDYLCDRCGEVMALCQKGDKQVIKTSLSGSWAKMSFTCIDTDYKGGQLFLADDVIPYEFCAGYGSSEGGYENSQIREWLNLQYADGRSVSEHILPVRLSENNDSISDRVFCLSLAEIRSENYKPYTLRPWDIGDGNRYYWTRSSEDNSGSYAYAVQYNGHIASEKTDTMNAGIRPAYVLNKPGQDVTQNQIWYTGDVQERAIDGVTYTFRCIDPDYMDAVKKRGALFLCDQVIGGDKSVYGTNGNSWSGSELRGWLNSHLDNPTDIADTATTVRYSYSGAASNLNLSINRFTKTTGTAVAATDRLFCLSLEEAVRYQNILWKLNGSEYDNYGAGTYTMGYWLRTAVTGGSKVYRVSHDGSISGEITDNKWVGFRPAFVAVQSE